MRLRPQQESRSRHPIPPLTSSSRFGIFKEKGATVPDTRTLKTQLDRLAASYDARYLDTDPLGMVHRYSGRADREVAGVIAAALAYGGAGVIRASIERAL